MNSGGGAPWILRSETACWPPAEVSAKVRTSATLVLTNAGVSGSQSPQVEAASMHLTALGLFSFESRGQASKGVANSATCRRCPSMTDLPPIVASTVSEAWSEAFARLMHQGVHELTPLLLTDRKSTR